MTEMSAQRKPGRPSSGPRVTAAVRLPADLHVRLKAAAAERDVSVNWLLVRAATDFLDRLLPVDEIRWTRSDGETV